MSTPDSRTLRLLSAAAELRAGGASWEAVAAHLKRKAYKCRRWPIRYREYWAAAYLAADAFSMGDIPVALAAFRFRQIVPQRPPLPNLERWFGEIEKRPAFREHVLTVPLT